MRVIFHAEKWYRLSKRSNLEKKNHCVFSVAVYIQSSPFCFVRWFVFFQHRIKFTSQTSSIENGNCMHKKCSARFKRNGQSKIIALSDSERKIEAKEKNHRDKLLIKWGIRHFLSWCDCLKWINQLFVKRDIARGNSGYTLNSLYFTLLYFLCLPVEVIENNDIFFNCDLCCIEEVGLFSFIIEMKW